MRTGRTHTPSQTRKRKREVGSNLSGGPCHGCAVQRFLYIAVDHSGNLARFIHQFVELIGENGLHSVGKRVVWIVMNFH